MSYDIVITLDKNSHTIIDECNIAYLDLVVHSEDRIFSAFDECDRVKRGIVYRTSNIQQEYDRVLEIYGIDKSKNIQQSLWNAIRYSSLKEEFEKPWQTDLLMRRNKNYTFLTYGTILGEIIKEIKKSSHKATSITRLLKILHLLQYCKREDLKNELKTLFSFFIQQLKVLQRPKKLALVSKPIAEMLKVFCVADFMKIIILCYPVDVLHIFLKCSKRHKYNFCCVFEDTETQSYPIAWTLMRNCLPHLKLLLIRGARNLHSPKIHRSFYDTFYLSITESHGTEVGEWIYKLQIYNKRNYLVMQVIYLYLRRRQNIYPVFPTQILELLWKSIPDPFLTSRELICLGNRTVLVDQFLCNCWYWYRSNVICKEKSSPIHCVNSPRSLKQLARCAVRKNLAASYLEPPYYNLVGEIPQELQKYLQIEL